jgi:hypothetical protein
VKVCEIERTENEPYVHAGGDASNRHRRSQVNVAPIIVEPDKKANAAAEMLSER